MLYPKHAKHMYVKWTKGNNFENRLCRLQFLCTALLLNEINICTKVLVDITCSFRVINVPNKVQSVKKWTKDKNSKIRQCRVMFLVHCTSTYWDLSTYSFLLIRTRKDTCYPSCILLYYFMLFPTQIRFVLCDSHVILLFPCSPIPPCI